MIIQFTKEKNSFVIQHPLGSCWNVMGHVVQGKILVNAQEALWLALKYKPEIKCSDDTSISFSEFLGQIISHNNSYSLYVKIFQPFFRDTFF